MYLVRIKFIKGRQKKNKIRRNNMQTISDREVDSTSDDLKSTTEYTNLTDNFYKSYKPSVLVNAIESSRLGDKFDYWIWLLVNRKSKKLQLNILPGSIHLQNEIDKLWWIDAILFIQYLPNWRTKQNATHSISH